MFLPGVIGTCTCGISTPRMLVLRSSMPDALVLLVRDHSTSLTSTSTASAADRADAEHRLHVDDAEAADLHVMPQELVAGADQHVAVAARDRDHVVRHQPVAALDQVERGLGLADRAAPVNSRPTP
jgi:hypothetical protein